MKHSTIDKIRFKLYVWLWSTPTHWISYPTFQHLLQRKHIGKFLFFVSSICAYHWCSTISIEGWETRRWCDKCQDYEDMG